MPEEINDKPAEIKPKIVVVIPPKKGGEQTEIASAHDIIAEGKRLTGIYQDLPREHLEQEYKRIYSNDDLAIKSQNELNAILGVLVAKHKVTTENIRKLRDS